MCCRGLLVIVDLNDLPLASDRSSTAPLGNEWNTNQVDVVDVHLVNTTVFEALLDWAHRVTEVVHVAFFKPSTGERSLIVNAFEEEVDLAFC